MAEHEQTKAIAALFAGLTTKDLESAVASIRLTKNCECIIAILKDICYKIGITSDSYTIVAGFAADRLNLDFVMANKLQQLTTKLPARLTYRLAEIGSAVLVWFLSASDITWKKSPSVLSIQSLTFA